MCGIMKFRSCSLPPTTWGDASPDPLRAKQVLSNSLKAPSDKGFGDLVTCFRVDPLSIKPTPLISDGLDSNTFESGCFLWCSISEKPHATGSREWTGWHSAIRL